MDNLIQKAKNKDKNAFTELVELYKKELYVIAKSRLTIEADIEDAIQETLFDAYINLDNLKNNENFKTWITKILINNCNDILRYKKGNIICFNEEKFNYIEDKENSIQKAESDQNFFEMINFLKADDKSIIIMRYSLKYTIHEISEALHLNDGAVRMRILRIKDKIKERYEGK